MFSLYANAFKIKDLRKKLLYVLLIVLIFRIGSQIPAPGIDMDALTQVGGGGIIGLLMGGQMGTIFAMGIGPYITASIIMQLLTVAIPYLENLKKDGEEGRKKINNITRIMALIMAVLEASGRIFSQRGAFFPEYQNIYVYFIAALAMISGTMFIVWLSELLTEKGVGSGASFVIFANIISNLPGGVMTLYNASLQSIWHTIAVIFILSLFAFIVLFTVYMQEGQRKIPVQYSKKMTGRQMSGGQASFIPVKVNIAGVIAVIFASSVLGFPQQLMIFFGDGGNLARIGEFLSFTSFTGAPIYIVLIFLFTFFYTSFAVNPIEMAENLKKNGGFIPGIRPGKPTSDYISRVVGRMSWVGASFVAILAILPIVVECIFGIPVGFGGNTIIIVVGVALEFSKQMESQLVMRNYKGFLSS